MVALESLFSYVTNIFRENNKLSNYELSSGETCDRMTVAFGFEVRQLFLNYAIAGVSENSIETIAIVFDLICIVIQVTNANAQHLDELTLHI